MKGICDFRIVEFQEFDTDEEVGNDVNQVWSHKTDLNEYN